jgi:hypothetical protein
VAWVRLATAGDDEASADGKKNGQNVSKIISTGEKNFCHFCIF